MDADAIDADIILTMGRLPQTVTELKKEEDNGAAVITADMAFGDARSRLDKTMREKRIPMPPVVGKHGYWLKQGDAAAQSKKDVVYCKDEQALTQAKADFASRRNHGCGGERPCMRRPDQILRRDRRILQILLSQRRPSFEIRGWNPQRRCPPLRLWGGNAERPRHALPRWWK